MNREEKNEGQIAKQSAQQSEEQATAKPKPSDGSGLQVPPPKTGVEKRGI